MGCVVCVCLGGFVSTATETPQGRICIYVCASIRAYVCDVVCVCQMELVCVYTNSSQCEVNYEKNVRKRIKCD